MSKVYFITFMALFMLALMASISSAQDPVDPNSHSEDVAGYITINKIIIIIAAAGTGGGISV